MLGMCCPSLYDLRNIFQVNVEEGRHLWAMVYLLHRYFGRDGREEAEALLERRSGDVDNPRILGAFNEPTPDWLAFYMFTFFTDRDGKFQLSALAESGFDPLARTCRFMLTEEAHHMFVGETGVSRILQRTCEVMREHKVETPGDVRALGVIDLETMQKYLNFHYSVTIDLFGSDASSNAATYYTTGLKGRYDETKIEDDHVLADEVYPVFEVVGNKIVEKKVPALTALNERLRDDYIHEIQAGVDRWNRVIENAGISFRLGCRTKDFIGPSEILRDTLSVPRGSIDKRGLAESRARLAACAGGSCVCAIVDDRARGGTGEICELDRAADSRDQRAAFEF